MENASKRKIFTTRTPLKRSVSSGSHLQGKLPAESLSKPLIMFDACAALILLLK